MAKQKKGNPIHGWVNFNKPYGMTSTQAVGFIKHAFNAQKAGHGGTLDPLANGVLPIALGEATKTMAYSLDATKTYRFTMQFGTQMNTDDAEGEPVKTSDARPTKQGVLDIIPKFTGDIEQIPPAYSAIKIDGKPAYKRIRAGEDVQMKPRPTTINALELVEFTEAKEGLIDATLDATVSKGTYIRALARDMGEALECYAYVTVLTRVKAGCFAMENTVSKEELDKCIQNGDSPLTFLQDIATVLADTPAYVASPLEVKQLKSGVQLQRFHLKPGVKKVVTQKGTVISLIEVMEDGAIKVIRNLNV